MCGSYGLTTGHIGVNMSHTGVIIWVIWVIRDYVSRVRVIYGSYNTSYGSTMGHIWLIRVIHRSTNYDGPGFDGSPNSERR